MQNNNLDINYVQHLFSKRYAIIELAGRGGMSWVFKARHLQLNRIVALKILNPQLNSDWDIVNRFYQEIKIGATLNHPNILKIHYGGQLGELHFMEMDFLKGETLFERIHRSGRITQKQTIRFAKACASALAHIHQHKIVHRDIKSANVFLDSKKGVLLTDFGISFYINNPANIPENSIMGTPEYMSPEQASGKRLPDHRSDLYSLGVVLFECLTGNVPFKGNTPAATINHIINTPPPSPRNYQIQIAGALEQLVMRLLSKGVDERYNSAYEIFTELNQLDKGGGRDWFKQIQSLFRGNNKYSAIPYKLIQVGNNSAGNTFPLAGKQTGNEQISCIIGRATPGGVQPDVNIPEPTISRKHIEIVIIGGQLGVRHLYSENRTSINGNLLEAGVIYQLVAGDKLILGKVEFELVGL